MTFAEWYDEHGTPWHGTETDREKMEFAWQAATLNAEKCAKAETPDCDCLVRFLKRLHNDG